MRFRFALGVFSLCLLAHPASAQDWQVYDTFEAPLIDPVLWGAGHAPCQNALECERLARGGSLWLRIRAYNEAGGTSGTVWSQSGVEIAEQPALVNGMSARLAITRAAGTFCSGVPSTVGQMGLRAIVFHSHRTSGESPNAPWNDEVEANLYMYPHPDGTADVGGIVHRMGDVETPFSQQLGTVRIGEVVDIWLRWDWANRTVFFGMRQLRQLPVEVGYQYSSDFPNAEPSLNPYRMLQLQASPVNCPGVRLFSDVAAKIDRVAVIR